MSEERLQKIIARSGLCSRREADRMVAEGRVYFLNREGLATVVSASSRYDRLTENQLDDETIASPATSDGKIFIRGRKWLYCLSR